MCAAATLQCRGDNKVCKKNNLTKKLNLCQGWGLRSSRPRLGAGARGKYWVSVTRTPATTSVVLTLTVQQFRVQAYIQSVSYFPIPLFSVHCTEYGQVITKWTVIKKSMPEIEKRKANVLQTYPRTKISRRNFEFCVTMTGRIGRLVFELHGD